MKKDLRKKAKSYFKKDFSNFMNNTVFGKTMENIGKHGDIKLATTERIKYYLVSEQIYYTTKLFFGYSNEKTQTYIMKPVYLRISILQF